MVHFSETTFHCILNLLFVFVVEWSCLLINWVTEFFILFIVLNVFVAVPVGHWSICQSVFDHAKLLRTNYIHQLWQDSTHLHKSNATFHSENIWQITDQHSVINMVRIHRLCFVRFPLENVMSIYIVVSFITTTVVTAILWENIYLYN